MVVDNQLQKVMIELLFHRPTVSKSDSASLSAHSDRPSVDMSPSVTLSDLSRPLDPIGEDNEGYMTDTTLGAADYGGGALSHRDMLDSRSTRFSPAVVSHSCVSWLDVRLDVCCDN